MAFGIQVTAKATPNLAVYPGKRIRGNTICLYQGLFWGALIVSFVSWYLLNWNTSKGNQAPIQKFERPNRKIEKS